MGRKFRKFGISIGLPPLAKGTMPANPPPIRASRRASAGVYLRSELQLRDLMKLMGAY